MKKEQGNKSLINKSITYCKLSTLKSLFVATQEGGQMLGQIRYVLIEPRQSKLLGFFVNHHFWQRDGYFVPVSEVVSLGSEVIQIKSLNWCEKLKKIGLLEKQSFDHFKGYRVTTQKGEYLGKLQDALFNSENWEISKLFLSSKKVLILENQDLVMGKDEIIVLIRDPKKLKILGKQDVNLLSSFLSKIKRNKVTESYDKNAINFY